MHMHICTYRNFSVYEYAQDIRIHFSTGYFFYPFYVRENREKFIWYIYASKYIWICILAITRIGTFYDMHLPKVPTVDPSLENSSQPKKFVSKSFFHLPHRNFMLQKYPIFRSNGGGERLIQFPFFLFLWVNLSLYFR